MKASSLGFLTVCGIVLTALGPATGQNASAQSVATVGPVTGLEIPRYVSIKNRARARRGPSTKYKIDWVYERAHLPVKVEREFGHWRRVVDFEGQGGWIHYALLSNARYVLFTRERHEIRLRPGPNAKPVAYAQNGVVALVEECEPNWCLVRADKISGWTHKSGLWGVNDGEVVE